MRKLVYAIACLMLSVAGWAQQRTVSGTVTDNNNAPIAGASVTVKDANVGTHTDSAGNFNITVPAGSKTLVITSIGFVLQEVPFDGRNHVSVSMKAANNNLDQVIVIGYTAQRKQDLTGSVAVVDLTPVKNNSSGNVMQALQGRVPGLYIEKNGGSPNGSNNRILIRGSNTLGNNDPLYIIDGIPTTRPEVFQNLNPASISSVQVLKDASAESIYGARASNGVIIVTTKNGGNTNGKVVFQFDNSLSVQSEKAFRYKMLNAVDRGKALWQASVNDGQDPTAGYGEIYKFDWNGDYNNPVLKSVAVQPFVGGDPNTPAGNTDWQNVMYKKGIVTNNSLTASVGNKNSSLEINLGYLNNTGMLRYTDYRRYSGSINAITRAFNDKAVFGVNLRVANSNEKLIANDLGGAATTALAITLAPTIPVYQKDGVTFAGESGAGYSDRNNPLHMQYLSRWNNTNRLSSFGNIFLEIQPIKNLFFKSNIGADNAYYLNKVISPTFTEGALSRTTNSLLFDQNHYLSTTFSNTLRYNLNIGEHSLKFLAGTEYIKTDLNYQTTKKEGFAVQTEDYFTLNAATGNTNVSGGSTGHRLFSEFGRIDYNYADRYLLAVTVRRDGSSRFGSNNQFGVFPAASVGWRIDKENFMKNNAFFSELKLRAGIGRVGNQEIGDLARFGLFDTRYGTALSQLVGGFWEQYMNIGTAYSLSGANTGTLPSGFVQIQAANPDLKWETTDEINTGIDFNVWQNRIFGSFDYFSRKTTGILIVPPVASALGEGQSKAVNGASKSNKGWELVLGYRGEKIGQLRYNVQLNFAHWRDRITELPENVRPAYPGNLVNTIIGHSQFDIFGYKTAGLFQSQDEVNKAPTQIGAGPGRIRYVDINNDGVINDLDRTWIGTTLPALEYGARIDLSYKQLDVSIFGSGVTGRKGFDNYTFYNNLMKSRENVGPGVFDAWTPQHTNTHVPALTLKDNNNEGRTSDYFIVSTSYFRMRSIQVGYTLSPKAIFTRVRLFAMGENLFVFKNKSYLGPDPERTDINTIPIPKTLTVGLNATF
jgi:TonB-dependent starch-binding outer membrane protein SusC